MSHLASWSEDLLHLQNDKGVDTIIHVNPPTDKYVRLSPEVEQYLQEQGESAQDLLRKGVIVPPPADPAHPLTHYFISSSHNTYLLSCQLLGQASALTYAHVLLRHARCVELDVWPGLVVTHGYTWSTSVPLRQVVETIGTSVREGSWPVFASLECHVSAEEQEELVKIMKECWGEKLVDAAVATEDGAHITPGELKGKILLMVEYYPEQTPPADETEEAPASDSSSSSDDEEEGGREGAVTEQAAKEEVVKSEKDKMPPKISEKLAQLGVYARSMKPSKGWFNIDLTEPANVMINISESALSSLAPTSHAALVEHAARHLRRVYPRGTRIESTNLNPIKFWSNGSHIAALNWQSYDRGTQLNEAMFVGTPGYVLKPPRLLPGTNWEEKPKKERMKWEVIGLSSLPAQSNLHVYIRAQLLYAGKTQEWRSKTVKCHDVSTRGHNADFMYNEEFSFEYDEDDLTFIRVLVDENVSFRRDVRKAVFVARTEYLEEGLCAVRLLSSKGKDTGATLLVRISFETVE